jgi:hypothetical protein
MDNHPLFVDYPKLKRLDQVFNKDLDNYDFMFAYVNYPKELENKIKKVIKTEKFF